MKGSKAFKATARSTHRVSSGQPSLSTPLLTRHFPLLRWPLFASFQPVVRYATRRICFSESVLTNLLLSKKIGTVKGYIFSSLRSRRRPVSFKAVVPKKETFENPRYVRVEDRFTQQTAPGELHDCRVVMDKSIFLITAYWKNEANRNDSVSSACGGLVWKGEIAVVQVGRLVPFYKRPKNPSSVNRAVARFVIQFSICVAVSNPGLPSRFITEFKHSMAVAQPYPTYINTDD